MHDTSSLQNGLAVYFVLIALLNAAFAWHYCRSGHRGEGTAWFGLTLFLLLLAGLFFAHHGPMIPAALTEGINFLMGPVTYTSLSIALFALFLTFRKVVVQPSVAWGILMATLILGGWAMTNDNFRSIVAKEDNVPITMLIYSVGFCTWLAMYQAVQNDERIAKGEPVLEKLDDEKVLVWPDLVYTELIAMIVCTVALT